MDYNITSYGIVNQEYIKDGDQISGFSDGYTYTIVWTSNNQILGIFSA